jgi:FixJ family two-component response regulator
LPVGVLVLTAYDDDPYVQAVLEAGANGYVLKNASSEDIVQAVHTVHEGQMALDPSIARKIVTHWMSAGQAPAEPLKPHPSPREMDVLRLVARGMTNKAIAAQLKISERTVQGHIASLFQAGGILTAVSRGLDGAQRTMGGRRRANYHPIPRLVIALRPAHCETAPITFDHVPPHRLPLQRRQPGLPRRPASSILASSPAGRCPLSSPN